MGNIRLYGSTSGYTELAPPAVAPDGVLSLPSGVGTLLTAEGGKVLQVVRATDTTLRTTTSTSFVDASISVTITPQKNDSSILIIWTALQAKDGANDYLRSQITDNSNNPISGAKESYMGSSNATNLYIMQTLIAYDSPATTSATTYKGRFRSDLGSQVRLLNAQPDGQMYAIEVSA